MQVRLRYNKTQGQDSQMGKRNNNKNERGAVMIQFRQGAKIRVKGRALRWTELTFL